MATPSIAMIPSGVKAGKVYSVLPTPVYGEELVVNGDFATDSDWTKETGWSISNGEANANVSGTSAIFQTGIEINKKYKVTYTVSNYISGDIRIRVGTSSTPTVRSSNGTFTENLYATGTNQVRISPFTNGFIGSIDNVSVKEVLINADFDFTRASTATRVNSQGLLETVASNVPRLDYSNGDCPSLLLENQSTNLITYSEDFGNAYWNKRGLTTAVLNLISPRNDLSAYSLSIGKVNTADFYKISITSTNGTVYIPSFYIKNINLSTDIVKITNGQSGSPFGSWDIDLSLIENKWERITASHPSVTVLNSFVSNGTSIGLQFFTTATDNTLTSFGFFGVQLEENSFSTSYIPTLTGTTQTRVAETCGGAGDASSINSEEGVLYAEISALSNDLTTRRITLSDGTSNDRIILQYQNSSNRFRCLLVVGGVTQFDTSLVSETITNFNKVAVKYKENDFALWINGVKVYSNLTGNTFASSTLNKISFDGGTGSNPFYGNTKDLRVYNTALTDSELQALTTP